MWSHRRSSACRVSHRRSTRGGHSSNGEIRDRIAGLMDFNALSSAGFIRNTGS